MAKPGRMRGGSLFGRLGRSRSQSCVNSMSGHGSMMMDEEDRTELDKVAQLQASLRNSMGDASSPRPYGMAASQPGPMMAAAAAAVDVGAEASQWPIFCDVCDSPITLDNWYHKRGDQYDLCLADFRAVPEHEQCQYVLVHETADLGAERGPYEDAFMAHAQGLQNTQGAQMVRSALSPDPGLHTHCSRALCAMRQPWPLRTLAWS